MAFTQVVDVVDFTLPCHASVELVPGAPLRVRTELEYPWLRVYRATREGDMVVFEVPLAAVTDIDAGHADGRPLVIVRTTRGRLVFACQEPVDRCVEVLREQARIARSG